MAKEETWKNEEKRIYLQGIAKLSLKSHDKMEKESTIKAIREILHRIDPEAEIILYGSEARGEATADSDIDLLILVDKEKLSYQDIISYTYPLYDLELTENVRISPLVYTRDQWNHRPFKTPFYVNVMNEGIRL
jgi:predicted nucleotidyltransferase